MHLVVVVVDPRRSGFGREVWKGEEEDTLGGLLLVHVEDWWMN